MANATAGTSNHAENDTTKSLSSLVDRTNKALPQDSFAPRTKIRWGVAPFPLQSFWMGCTPIRELDPVDDIQAGIDLFEVGFYRVLAHFQGVGDLAIGQAAFEQGGYLGFPGGKANVFRRAAHEDELSPFRVLPVQMIPKWGDLHEFGSVQALILMQPTLVPTRAQQVDEFGELDRQVKAFAAKAKRHKALQDAIRSWYLSHPPELSAVADGTLYEVQVSECGEERSLSVPARLKIFAILKKARFVELVSITLKAVESAPELGEALLNKLATKERTGSRKLVVVAKSPASAVVQNKAA